MIFLFILLPPPHTLLVTKISLTLIVLEASHFSPSVVGRLCPLKKIGFRLPGSHLESTYCFAESGDRRTARLAEVPIYSHTHCPVAGDWKTLCNDVQAGAGRPSSRTLP